MRSHEIANVNNNGAIRSLVGNTRRNLRRFLRMKIRDGEANDVKIALLFFLILTTLARKCLELFLLLSILLSLACGHGVGIRRWWWTEDKESMDERKGGEM